MLAQQDTIRRVTSAAINQASALNALNGFKSIGYGVVSGPAVEALLDRVADGDLDKAAFFAAWNGMPKDGFMADGGTYRERTFATYEVRTPGGPFERTEPRAHFQGLAFNKLNGDVERVYQPTLEAFVQTPIMQGVMEGFRAICEDLSPVRRWIMEIHQFRIVTSPDEIGKPTPEGMHRDGVDFGLVMLVARENIRGGRTTIATPDGVRLREMTLRQPFETLLLDDPAVRHGVSEVASTDPTKPAYRDTLVITLKALT